MIRQAEPPDLSAVLALLADAKLPTDGVAENFHSFYRAGGPAAGPAPMNGTEALTSRRSIGVMGLTVGRRSHGASFIWLTMTSTN